MRPLVKKSVSSFLAILAGSIFLVADVIGAIVLFTLEIGTLCTRIVYVFTIESIFAGIAGIFLLFEGFKSFRRLVPLGTTWTMRGAILAVIGFSISILELVFWGIDLRNHIGFYFAIMLTAFRSIGVELSVMTYYEARKRSQEEHIS